MSWLLIGTIIIILWVVSLLKVFYFSKTVSNASIFPTESEIRKKGRNILLVIAHPDDESMFFAPTLLFLASEHHTVHIICISTGNADGKGEIRKKELHRACAILKVSRENINILDHAKLQDGFGNTWDHQLLSAIICGEIDRRNISLIITFDNYGVSGHCNHRDVHYGLCKFLSENSTRNIEAWELESISIFRKYSGPLDIWMSILHNHFYPKGHSCCLVNAHPQKCFLAMAAHQSQWIWFRKLFVLFSSYTYVNVLRKISS